MGVQIEVAKVGNRYEARFPFSYATKDLVKAAGFRFDGTRKVWWTADAAIAAKVSGDGDEIAARMNADAAAKRERDSVAVEASRATRADVALPAPEGLAYLPYQKAGIAYAIERDNALIADSMGLGKTIQAIGIVNSDPTIRSVLIVAPATLKLNWRNELAKWLVRPLTVGIANGHLPTTDVVIVNYEQVQKYRAEIDARSWDLLVADECHYLKNPKAQRTVAILGRWDRDPSKKVEPIAARRRVFMTGTPILNRPIEFWTLAHYLDPNGLGKNWRTYVTRYCAGHQTRYGWDVSGATNLDELQAKARAAFMIRRLKSEVLKDLPAKRRQIVVLPANGASDAVATENGIARRHEDRLAELRADVELSKASDDPVEYDRAIANLRSASATAFEEMSKARHDVAIAKVPYVVEHVREIIETGAKVVVMAHHLDVVAAIAAEFEGCVTLTGETKLADRQAAVDRFQTDPTCRVFVGSIRAAGVGITLTAAAHVVFAELDWVPGIMSQAEDRCHRIGQAESVLIQHVVLDGSVDCRMAETLVAKQAILDQALDRGERLPEAEHFEAPIAVAATETVSRRQIIAEAEKVDPALVARVLAGLRTLAGLDGDRAMELNGIGFNKADSHVGHALAARPTLTARQAVLGERLCRRYRRQLGGEWAA